MPRYYFHLRNDVDAPDEEGSELPDIETARAKAIAEVRHMAAATVEEHGKINLNHRIDVEDGAGQALLSVSFGDVILIES